MSDAWKPIRLLTAALSCAALLALTACGGSGAQADSGKPAAHALTVALVTPEKAGDGGPTDQMLVGLAKSQKQFGLKTRHIEATDPSTYESTLTNLGTAKTDVVIVAFTQFADAIKAVAPQVPAYQVRPPVRRPVQAADRQRAERRLRHQRPGLPGRRPGGEREQDGQGRLHRRNRHPAGQHRLPRLRGHHSAQQPTWRHSIGKPPQASPRKWYRNSNTANRTNSIAQYRRAPRICGHLPGKKSLSAPIGELPIAAEFNRDNHRP